MSTPKLAKVGPPPLWRNISFMLMWSSIAASGFGDRVIQLAAEPMLGVTEADASAAGVQAGVMFWFFLPYMLLTLVGGWLSDHVSRKWLMFACDEGRAIVLFVACWWAVDLGLGQAVPEDRQWQVYAIIALTGCCAAIFNPTRLATVPQIVRKADLQPANAVVGSIALIASLIGVVASGPLLDKQPAWKAILIGGIAFGVSGLFFPFMRIHGQAAKHETTNIFKQLAQGVGYLRSHRTVAIYVALNILFWAAAYVVNAAVASLNRDYYGIPVDEYLTHRTAMLGITGLGMILGCLYVMWHRTRREAGIIAMAAFGGAALTMVGLATIHVYWIGLVLALFAGLFGGVGLVCLETLTQAVTPNHVRGRVFGVRAQLNTLSGVLVNLAIWQLPTEHADRWMIPVLIATASILGLVSLRVMIHHYTTGPHATRWLNVIWKTVRIYSLVWHRLRWVGRHNVPSEGPVLIAANHTTGIDPFLVQSALPRTIRWVMTAPYRFKILEPMWRAIEPIALDDEGPNLANLRTMLKRLKDREIVGIFPEGGLQRDHRDLQPFRAGVGMLAQRGKATIVPVWISGTPRRKSIWSHFLTPSKSLVTFGQPYKPDPDWTHEEVVEDLRRRMVELAQSVED